MGKREVTIEELIDLAIGTPETTVNFLILQKVLKLISRYGCEMDYKFEIDTENMRADIIPMRNQSRSSFSESQGSYESNADSGHTETNVGIVEAIDRKIDIKKEKDDDDEDKEERSHVKTESHSQEHSSEQKMSESEQQKQSKKSSMNVDNDDEKDAAMEEKKDEKKEEKKKKKKESDSHRKKSSEKHKRRSSGNVREKDSGSNKVRDSDNTKNRMHALENFTKKSDDRTNELENHFKELADRIESITETIAKHLDERHLAEINEEIDKLKKNVENTTDQCFEVTNTINDQSLQIQDILTTIDNIQLRKVENEELIDLLSGKADHSFVNEKVSTSQFEEIIQELKDSINEGTTQLDSARLETNTSLDEIKQELLTKLLAEEFDAEKTKIFQELVKLTEQHELILAQQSEHVAAGAKMRNLNCFVCNNDVVMLLEQETIPKFRGLKSCLPPLEPVVGSKVFISKNAPEWKNHLLQAKDYTRTSKTSRFQSNATYEKSETYVKGKNGCMYKGKNGCDCVEGMNAIGRSKRASCCEMVEANNRKNISQTNYNSKVIGSNGVGDVVKSADNIDDSTVVPQMTSADETNLNIESIVESTIKIATNAIAENDRNANSENLIDGNLIKNETENIVSGLPRTEEVPIETNTVNKDDGAEVENR